MPHEYTLEKIFHQPNFPSFSFLSGVVPLAELVGITPIPYVIAVVVGVYPIPSEVWGMAGDHGAPKAGQLPRTWTRGRTETESCQRVSGAKSP